MLEQKSEKKETPMERADRIARQLIETEQRAREKKTSRLRDMRLNMQKSPVTL